jgi:hypothetical protein
MQNQNHRNKRLIIVILLAVILGTFLLVRQLGLAVTEQFGFDGCFTDLNGTICRDSEGNLVAFTPWSGSLEPQVPQHIQNVETSIACEIEIGQVTPVPDTAEVVVKVDQAFLYSDPDLGSPQLLEVHCGERFLLTAHAEDSTGMWYLIALADESQAWIPAPNVKVLGIWTNFRFYLFNRQFDHIQGEGQARAYQPHHQRE